MKFRLPIWQFKSALFTCLPSHVWWLNLTDENVGPWQGPSLWNVFTTRGNAGRCVSSLRALTDILQRETFNDEWSQKNKELTEESFAKIKPRNIVKQIEACAPWQWFKSSTTVSTTITAPKTEASSQIGCRRQLPVISNDYVCQSGAILSSSIKAVSAVTSGIIGEQDHTKIILMFLFSFGCMKFSDIRRSRREAQLRSSTQHQGVEVEVSIFHTSLFVKICSGLSIAVTCRTLWRFLFPSFMFGDVGPHWDTFGIPKYFNAFLESTSFLERQDAPDGIRWTCMVTSFFCSSQAVNYIEISF